MSGKTIDETLSELDAGSISAFVSFDSEYTQTIIEHTLSTRPCISISTDKSEHSDNQSNQQAAPMIQWCEFEQHDWSAAINATKNPSIVSSYLTRKGLIRKAQLAYSLKKFMLKRPASSLHGSVPETFIVELDHIDYIDECLCDLPEVKYMDEHPEDRFLLKPSLLNQARSLTYIQCLDDFIEALEADPEIQEWVVQRYIRQPHLIDGCKYHIRSYVLAVGNMCVYLWGPMLALLAPSSYDAESYDRRAHITNTCAHVDDGDVDEEHSVRLLSDQLSSKLCTKVTKQMVAIIHDVFEALHSEPTVYQPMQPAFELYGFDWLVDQEENVWFLEANAGPDFAMTGDKLSSLIEGLMEQTTRLCIDPYIKHIADQQPSKSVNLASLAQQSIDEAHVSIISPQDVSSGAHGFLPCYSRTISHSMTMRMH